MVLCESSTHSQASFLVPLQRTDEENICNIEDVMSVSVRHEVAEVQLDLTEGFPRVRTLLTALWPKTLFQFHV